MTKKMSGAERYNLLLSLVGFLLNHNEVSVDELAQRFGVTAKEIRSAIATITVSGIGSYAPNELFDVDFDRLETDSVVELTFNPAIDDVPRLSVRQVAALSAGLNYLKQLPGFSQREEVENLIKILAKGSVTTPTPIFAVKPGTVDADAATIRLAITNDKQISFEYQNAQGELLARTVDPLLLESRDSTWYLRGYCHTRQEVRTFRLNRMRNSQMLAEQRSEISKTTELSEEIYNPKPTDTVVVIDLMPEAYHLIADFRPAEDPVDLGDGKKRISIQVGNLNILGKVIARCAGNAVVISPPEARKVVRDYALSAIGESTDTSTQAED